MQLLEKEVSEGRKRCSELEEELDQVNKEIGEARVRHSFLIKIRSIRNPRDDLVRSK